MTQNKRQSDQISDLMGLIRSISGISLGPDKRSLVETRLFRRTRQLGLNSIEQYHEYFYKHREKEVNELVSLITTHTTQFFRESAHFDHLTDVVFPKLLGQRSRPIKIWSAAASSGEEVYSLGISWLEFLRSRSIAVENAPRCQITGSDIDFNMVAIATKGIYPAESVEGLSPSLVERYFSRGSGDLAHLVKVKDAVHRICNFKQFNLISDQYPQEQFDIIFLRNVLIYFEQEIIQKIASQLERCLGAEGVLYVGHSESFSKIKSDLEVYGNSIYRPKHAANVQGIPTGPRVEAVAAVLNAPLKTKIRVFIIDDSATIRNLLKLVLKQDPQFEVVGEAENPTQIPAPLSRDLVDIVTLDIHMPEQDGISYLKSVKGRDHPPIVMISSVSYQDGTDYMNCLELGAVDYIEKPSGQTLAVEGDRIRHVLKAAAQRPQISFDGSPKREKPMSTTAVSYTPTGLKKDLIVIGASTGGVEALKILLRSFPKNSPPVLIVQHIPQEFSKTLAERLNQTCPLHVKEAADHDLVQPGQALIAPGGKQMKVHLGTRGLEIEITDDPPVNRHRPSVDYLFRSVAALGLKWNMAAALLTGMGDDGAQGLLQLRQLGMHTIAQDEESCVVYGMPKVAVELNAAVEVLPLQSISYHLFKGLQRRIKAVA